jgi:hypothetical protein
VEVQEDQWRLGGGGYGGVGELKQKCEGLVERSFKRTAIALLISFFGGAAAVASEPTEGEVRGVISAWRNVKGVIENGTPVNHQVPVHYLYGRIWEERLTATQKAEILQIARQVDRWRDVWFIGVKFNRRGDFNTIVYFLPDRIEGRLRRGKAVGVGFFGPRQFDYVQVGSEPLDEFPPSAPNLPFPGPQGLTNEEILELVNLVYHGSRQKLVSGPHQLPRPDRMRNPFLRDNTGRVDVPVLSPKYAMRGLLWMDETVMLESEPDRTKPILRMSRSGDVVHVSIGEQRHGRDGMGQTVKCKKAKGAWVMTDVSGPWVN